jgi:3-phenylpropionate/trans-cinnamate dioxygenase ferredoxin component
MSAWMLAARTSEIAEGGRKSVIVDEVPALLIRAGDHYYCIEDQCTHDSQPLTDGKIENGCIVCPRHGAMFDLVSGEPKRMPATEPIRTFPVEVRPDGIFINESP